MKRNPVSLILGFYAESALAESGYREVRAAGMERVCLIQPDGTSGGKAHLCDRYSALRLEGESLVVAETEPANVEAVVQRLRQGSLLFETFLPSPLCRERRPSRWREIS
jgi:hypothetical protein